MESWYRASIITTLSLSFFHLLLSVAHVPLDYNGCSTTTAADYSHIQACPWYALLCTWLMGALILTNGSPFLLSILRLHMRVSLVFLFRPVNPSTLHLNMCCDTRSGYQLVTVVRARRLSSRYVPYSAFIEGDRVLITPTAASFDRGIRKEIHWYVPYSY